MNSVGAAVPFIGASGASGFAGASGISGQSGYSGFSGFSGISGYSGYSGISGYSGYSGTSGFSGYSGYSGVSGFSGYSGFSGISGYSGYSGVSGYSGYSGLDSSGPTLVQQKTATGAEGNATATFDVGATAGNSIIVCVSSATGIEDILVNLVGGGDGALTQSPSFGGALGINSGIFYLHNIPSGVTGIIVDDNGSAIALTFNASEWSGLSNSTPSATNSNANAASTAVTTGSVTPTAHNIIIATYGSVLSSYVSGPDSGMTALTASGGTGAFQRSAYIIQTSATAKNTGWTVSLDSWAATAAAFSAP